jgi:hypothetical protein
VDGKSFRATRQLRLCTYNEYDIVKHFSSLIRGLVKYYSFVSQRSQLWKVLHLIRKSCALTLASKFNLSTAASVYKKFGITLSIYKEGKLRVSLYYPKTLKTIHKYNAKFNMFAEGLQGQESIIPFYYYKSI